MSDVKADEDVAFLRYVPHAKITLYEALGWVRCDALTGTHHGKYADLMRWDGAGSPKEPSSMFELKTASDIAARAADLVSGDRERQHGTKLQNFENIAALWNAYLRVRRDPSAPLDGADVGHLMVLLKVARTQLGGFNVDDWQDMVGYAACAGEVAIAYEHGEQAMARAAASANHREASEQNPRNSDRQ